MSLKSATLGFWIFFVMQFFIVDPAMADIQCYECHGTKLDSISGDYRPVDSPIRDIFSGGFPGSHRTHLSGPSSPSACAKCHPGSEEYQYGHRNKAISISDNINDSPVFGEYWNNGSKVTFKNQTSVQTLGKCTNVNCHFESVTPTWGAGRFEAVNPCSSCHGAPPQDRAHITHASRLGFVNNSGSVNASCGRCHNDHALPFPSYAHATSAGKRAVKLVGINYSKTTNIEYPTYLSSQLSQSERNGRCSNIDCHNHKGTSANWGSGGACLDCHSIKQGNRAAISGQFSFQSHHIQGPVSNSQCYQCHWEANSDGSMNLVHHQGSQATGSPVDLVVYGAGIRPERFSNGTTAVRYTPNGSRSEVQKITSHCSGCHSNSNNSTRPFGDGKTPKQYAWDGSSVAARYSQTGTTRWGKYSTANGANKRLTKAYSAHGNAGANARGWNTATGVDGAIADTSGAVNVQCYDCHNSHGSSASGITSRYSSATGKNRGGILKDTTIAGNGYTVAYKPYTGGSAASGNRRNPGASICLDCHMNKTAASTPWGYTSTYGAANPILGYWDLPFMGISTSGAEKRSYYKRYNGLKMGGGHFGSMTPLGSAPVSGINGLCTPCHDPHGVSPSLNENQAYSVPLLKGTWLTSPYKEDKAPKYNEPFTARSDARSWSWRDGRYQYYNLEGIPYNIDQNTFGNDIKVEVNGITVDDSRFAGLCLECHAKQSLTDGINHTWKSKERIHESVKGWKNPASGTVKHNYSCSKCHSAHTSSVLPRLMVTNCLDSKHKGQTGWALPVDTESSYGQAASQIDICGKLANRMDFCKTRSDNVGNWQGDGRGRIPGSYTGDSRFTEEHTVACHENANTDPYPGTSQGWNNVTPWYPVLKLVGSNAYLAPSDQTGATISITMNIPGSVTVEYGTTVSYGASASTNSTQNNFFSVMLPNFKCGHYRVKFRSVDGQELTTNDYFFDLAPPVVSFSVPATVNSLDIPFTFSATDETGVTEYWITVKTPASEYVNTPSSATPPTSVRVSGIGSYTLYPYAKDAAGNVSALPAPLPTVQVTDVTPPAEFGNAAPANGSTVPTSARVQSLAGSDNFNGAVQYLFQVSLDSSFSTGLQQSGWQTGLDFAPLLTPSATYYWRVKSRDASLNESAFTAPWSFTTATNTVLWTTKGDFENNASTTGAATTLRRIQISGFSTADNAAATFRGKALAAGSSHSLLLKADGTVWAWGENHYGQLGDATITQKVAPVQALGLWEMVDVAAGDGSSAAARSDGTVWAWGKNLGDGTTNTSTTPKQVPGLTGVAAVSTSGSQTLALKTDGTVWAWGSTPGNGTTSSSTPVQVTGLSSVVSVSAGLSHSLALKSDGTVWAWGGNASGQLGTGNTTTSLTPVRVLNLSNVSSIANGGTTSSSGFSLAVKADGTLWGWGNNTNGQLGNGGTTSSSVPVQATRLTSVVAVAAGSMHAMALTSDGFVWTWGNQYFTYQPLGYSTTNDVHPTPYKLESMAGVVAISAGTGHSIVLTGIGELWSWGYNAYGQLGNGHGQFSPLPLEVQENSSGLVKLAGGKEHTIVSKMDGTVWTWGRNTSYGVLGDGGVYFGRTTPYQVPGIAGVYYPLAAGAYHNIASNGNTLWVWGNNDYGQLGDGTNTTRKSPVALTGIDAAAVEAGENHSIILKSDGTVWTWGYNASGQLGDGTSINSNRPVQVKDSTGTNYLGNVKAVAAGNNFSMALMTDGTVWTWGYNGNGELGDGSNTGRLLPVKVTGLPGVVQSIAAGGNHALALLADGTVWGWGANSNGQLGNGTNVTSYVPVKVLNITGVAHIAAGSQHSLASISGSVWSWGYNGDGQLGDGTTTSRNTPYNISSIYGTTEIGAGENHSLVKRNNSALLKTWGSNSSYQLGFGNGTAFTLPYLTLTRDARISGTISNLKFNAGSTVNWGALFWNASKPGYSSISFKIRGADTENNLYSKSWSAPITVSGTPISPVSSQWLELELTMESSSAQMPLLEDFSVTYTPVY